MAESIEHNEVEVYVDEHEEVSDTFATISTEIPHIAEDDVLGNLGINGTLFTAQLINFLIVLIVLWVFAYKPLMKLMEERTKKIEDGVEKAIEMDKRLVALEREKEEVMKEARQEAKGIVNEATQRADRKREELTLKAKEEVEGIVAASRKQIQAQKETMMQELKDEIAEVVVAAAGKVAEGALDKDKANKSAKSVIEAVSKDI